MIKPILYLSQSSTNLYLTCPLLYKHKNTETKVQHAMLNFGSWIHAVIKEYFKHNQKRDILSIARTLFTEYKIELDDYLMGQNILKTFLDREYMKSLSLGQSKVLAFEQEFSDILPNGIALKGIVDLIIERDSDTIEIIDYKSGLTFYTVRSLQHNIQLKIYKNLVLNQDEYKKYKNILLTIDPLRYDPITIQHDDLTNDVFLDWMAQVYVRIRQDQKFEPNFPCANCKNCHITNLCPKYKELLKYDFKIKQKLEDKAKHFFELQQIKNIVERDLDFYKDFFKNYISKQTHKDVIVGEYSLAMADNQRLYIKRRKI